MPIGTNKHVELIHAQLTNKYKQMPRKIKELIKDLETAGFLNRGGRGSHRKFVHPRVSKFVILSDFGNSVPDAKHYQERVVKAAI